MDSRQAIVPVALRVNANLFQTDLCQNPESMDGFGLPSMALDTRFPAGMTSYLRFVYNREYCYVGTLEPKHFFRQHFRRHEIINNDWLPSCAIVHYWLEAVLR
jgi:hypothetical protein